MSIQFGGFLFFLLGLILFAATKAGYAYDAKAGYVISAFFIVYALLFEIAGYLDSELMLLLVFPLPIGNSHNSCLRRRCSVWAHSVAFQNVGDGVK